MFHVLATPEGPILGARLSPRLKSELVAASLPARDIQNEAPQRRLENPLSLLSSSNDKSVSRKNELESDCGSFL